MLLGIFLSGISIGLLQSLGYFPAVGLRQMTLKYYKEILADPGFLASLRFSLYTAFISSVLAVIMGVLLAYSILQSKQKKGIEELVYKLPIIVPHTVAVILVYNIFSQSGLLSRFLFHLGFINEPTQFASVLFNRNGFGIIFAYLWKEIPFVAMIVYTVLGNMNDKLSETALNLGASQKQVFWHVQLPLIMPSIVSAFIIIFAFSFGAFEVPFLLGPTYPQALPVKAYIEYTQPDLLNRPYAMAINMVLIFMVIVFIGICHKIFRIFYQYDGSKE